VLVSAQVLAALGGSGAAAGALLALEITGSESLACLPLALLVVGSSASALPVSAVSSRIGRRAGLTAALLNRRGRRRLGWWRPACSGASPCPARPAWPSARATPR
jgi:hypothetical protein